MQHADSARITGAAVIDREGEKVGTATDIIFDDVDLQPRWVVVRYGTLRHHHTAVPFDRLYVAEGGDVVVESDRDAVMQAPRVGRGAPLSPDEESSLESYFHASRS
jgi:uncharacterized protein YrrD